MIVNLDLVEVVTYEDNIWKHLNSWTNNAVLFDIFMH
jgi:hypothetical protein